MFNVARFLSAALLAQDRVIWVALGDALSQQLLSSEISLRNFRSVRFIIHCNIFPQRKDESTGLEGESF